MIALLANWRLIAAGGLVAAIVGGWLYVGHLRKEAATARSEAVSAQQGEAMADAETKTIVRYHTTERVIREAAEPIIQTIQEAADAETPVPPDVLAAWRAGVGRLREPGPSTPDDNRSRPAE